ncbi:MAG: hypothetical protein K5657_03680 [Desulfovibrio sp.]|nr:hypothetical protein [Desulfovibrio sp.]
MKQLRSFFVLFLFAFFVASNAYADGITDPFSQGKTRQGTVVLHGNTDSKVFHASDCEFFNCKSCTKVFHSKAEAQRAGYHPCSVCQGELGHAALKAGKLHGNPTTKVVHGPSCRYYNAKGSSEIFSSLAEAKRQGFHPCSICNGK